jgi:lipopolysaccharide export LptBFGC system permease protein LptF
MTCLYEEKWSSRVRAAVYVVWAGVLTVLFYVVMYLGGVN